jgi:hypothetical protein
MQLGMIGLGQMGANLVRRLMRDGHRCVAYDRNPDVVKGLEAEGATGAAHLGGFDDHPRLQLPSGKRKTPRKRPSLPGSASHAVPTDICRVSPGGTRAAPGVSGLITQ